MRRLTSTLFLFLFLFACATPQATLPPSTQTPPPVTSTPVPPLTGTFMGYATQSDGVTASVQVNLSESGSTVNIEPFTQSTQLTVEQTAGKLKFSAVGAKRDPFKQIEFTGNITNGIIPNSEGQPGDALILTGTITWDGVVSQTLFIPVIAINKTTLPEYEGVYRFESGRALSIIVSPEFTMGGMRFFSETLMLTDFESGALRSLYPTSDRTFLIGVLRDVGAPFDGYIEFVRDDFGKVTGLRWWNTSDILSLSPASAEFAARIEYTTEDRVEFISEDGTQLAGRLSLPGSTAPVPAFMMLHGSEPGRRDNFGAKLMAHFMISQGFAILNYDKRGVGASEGVYQEAANPANLQRHADDAIAGVQYLASRSEIDANRIGVIGGSQAGWVIPLAASQSAAITHLVILSGPVCSFVQENVFSAYTNDGETITKYDDATITRQIRNMQPGGFDPVPYIATLQQPGLWLWGDVDKSIPVTFSAENLQSMIDGGRTNFTYRIFSNADHGLSISPNGTLAELPYSPGLVFYQALTNWLKANM